MQVCQHCAYENTEGIFFCEECGIQLGEVAGAFVTLIANNVNRQYPSQARKVSATLPDDRLVLLQIGNNELFLPLTHKLILGRRTPDSQNFVVELSPYKAYEFGVSRNHATIQRVADGSLQLTDLETTNGTFINGERLIPLRSYQLYDGDTIQLGSLKFSIHFANHK